MTNARPFPIVRGGCNCGQIRYQLEEAPLFCYACHCTECQKSTGTVFNCCANVEFDKITVISPTKPALLKMPTREPHTRYIATCSTCHDALWNWGSYAPATLNVQVGTLDLPSLFEPDLHIFIEGKVHWLTLPEGTTTQRGEMDREKFWPKSSLARLEACTRRWEAMQKEEKRGERTEEGGDEKTGEQAEEAEGKLEEKTPTNRSPEPQSKEEEDDAEAQADEEYEKRYDEIEKALQERLEKLSLKLSDQEKAQS